MSEQTIVFIILFIVLVLFILDRWRYDIVAMLALLTVTSLGIVPGDAAFAGFGHPAVITVAGVLVINRALINSGVVDVIARWMMRVEDRPLVQVAALTATGALCSAIMNNVAAVALLMPVGIQMARRRGRSPSFLLMPLAYGSLLGGMMTLIGTPPNIIIATYRAQANATPFHMFDFTPVGLGVALVGLLYLSFLGWRLLPDRSGQRSREELFHIQDYTTEVRIPTGSKLAGSRLRDLSLTKDIDVVVVGLLRNGRRTLMPSSFLVFQPGDILIVQADSHSLKALIHDTGLELVGSEDLGEQSLGSDEISEVEAIVSPNSPIIGQTVRSLNLRRRYGMNLLAVARRGSRLQTGLGEIRFHIGDILLLQGRSGAVRETLSSLGCLPLAERDLRLGQPRRLYLAMAIFAIAILAASLGLLPIQVAIVGAAMAMVLSGLIPLRQIYTSIDWPVIVLLGGMIPVADALERTGGADWLAAQFLALASQTSSVVALALVLIGAMILTPLINNAAAAVLMAPIAISIARGLGVSPDPFLMAAAVGVSCDFLTPIGHQSNTLVMGPGGYKFGDYWRMGLPLEFIVIVVAVPLILWAWPL